MTDRPINAVSQHSLLSKSPQRCDSKGGGVKKKKKLTQEDLEMDERVGGRDLFFIQPICYSHFVHCLYCAKTHKSQDFLPPLYLNE